MIKGLYETHLFVQNLENSIDFYKNVLGLEQCYFEKERNLNPYNFLLDGTERPMVFAWMPAIAIYFNDPDGHSLEFIAPLEGEARPELGVISYDQWLRLATNSKPD